MTTPNLIYLANVPRGIEPLFNLLIIFLFLSEAKMLKIYPFPLKSLCFKMFVVLVSTPFFIRISLFRAGILFRKVKIIVDAVTFSNMPTSRSTTSRISVFFIKNSRNYSGTHEPRRHQGSGDSILNAIALMTAERIDGIGAPALILPTLVADK